ncbi:hypothetical protein AB0M43_01955 [Longispora sp. NPDC051575]|uniref:hypothetical protein n=1 Tax=Longispora sp. NPDC051575 TaxID=3154943 RepID=UPI00343C2129
MSEYDVIDVLGAAVRSDLTGAETAPELIRRVLEEDAWRSFTSPGGGQVSHERFDSFVTGAPPEGLGQSIPDLVQLAAGDPGTLGLLAAALGVHPADLVPSSPLPPADAAPTSPPPHADPVPSSPPHADPVPSSPPHADPVPSSPSRAAGDVVEQDAQHFGRYVRAGGWLFGLLVARNVRPASAEQSESPTVDTRPPKVSAAAFAITAGCSKDRVTRFYRAWERAALAGVVPGFEALTPGVDIELPEPHLWSEYFTSYERGSDRRESIAEQAEAAGSSYGDAVRVAEHPTALRTAILGDSRTAEAARKALVDRLGDDPALQSLLARDIAAMPAMRRAVSDEAKRTDQADYVRKIAQSGKARISSGEISLTDEAVRRIAEHLPVELPEEATAEEVATAYETAQTLIAEAVEADPETQLQERRHRFRRAITTSAKQIESIDADGVADLADDEIRETLIALQRKINVLAQQLTTTELLRAV